MGRKADLTTRFLLELSNQRKLPEDVERERRRLGRLTVATLQEMLRVLYRERGKE